jgi:hypothetical protein
MNTNFPWLNRALAGSLLAWAVLLRLATPAAGEDLTKDFRAAKAKLLQELRSQKPEIRAAAVKRFEEFPVPDAATTLLLQGSITQYPDVRSGCFQALRSYRNSEDVAKVLVADVLRDLKSGKADDATGIKLFVVLAADEPKVQALAATVLTQLEKSPHGTLLMILVVDQLAEQTDQPSAQSLYNLAEHPLASSHHGLKRALVQALCKRDDKEAVTRLVDYYLGSEGETRADIERRLVQLSGLSAEDKPDWTSWWAEKKEKFTFPMAAVKQEGLFANAVPRKAADTPSYYGLPLYGSRIVFIIDYSGSMAGAKMDAAKRELQNAIAVLPVTVKFNIVAFHSQVIPWKKDLQPVSPQIKQEAATWVASGAPTAMTNSYDALEAAIGQDCDAIYFLTDGAPTAGKVREPEQIVNLISRQNRIRRATINALGIGVGPQGNTFDAFLKTLAEKNFGVYRRLD